MKRNQYLDAMKAIACIFVVLIHCMFPGNVGLCFRAVARFAVPLFFMISGYFLNLCDKTDVEEKNKSIIRKIKKILVLILASGIVYSILESVKGFCLNDDFVISEFFSSMFSWELFLRFLITNTPFVYMPRWFLWALIYCYLFIFLFGKIKISNKYLYYISTIFLIILLGLEYSSILSGTEVGFYIGDSDVFVTIRNIFLFRALPWFVFGIWIREFNKKMLKVKFEVYFATIMFGVVITIIQSILMGDVSVYLGSVLIVFGMFGIAIKQKNKEFNKTITYIGNSLSLYVYILHGAVIDAYTLLERIVFAGQKNEVFTWAKPILVVVTSVIGAHIIYSILMIIRRKGNV